MPTMTARQQQNYMRGDQEMGPAPGRTFPLEHLQRTLPPIVDKNKTKPAEFLSLTR